MFTTAERELLLELLAFNKECQDDNARYGNIDAAEHAANLALIEAIKAKLN